MIELIFVIVVIGILAAVALPRFLSLGDSAKLSLVESFVGTLNRTTGQTMWSESLAKGHGGSISYGSQRDKFEGKSLSYYIDIPVYLDKESVDFHNCITSGTADPFIKKSDEGVYNVFCRDGNTTVAPKFVASENDTYAF